MQEKAIDEQIAALKSVIECIKDCKLEPFMPVEIIENCIGELEKQMMNKRFSAPAPAPAVQLEVQGWTNCNTGPSVPRNQPSPVPAVQRQFRGGICASTPGTQLQGLSNKRTRTDGPVIKFYTPQVATANNPYNRSASQHGLGVPLNQGVAHFGLPAKSGHSSNLGTKQSNVAEAQYLNHNMPKQL